MAKEDAPSVDYGLLFSRLDAERERRGLKWNRVAVLTGIDPSSISRWKSQDERPSLEAVVRLADFFGVSVDVLLGRLRLPAPAALSRSYVLNEREEAVLLAHRASQYVRKILDTIVRETDELLKRAAKTV